MEYSSSPKVTLISQPDSASKIHWVEFFVLGVCDSLDFWTALFLLTFEKSVFFF